MPGPQLSRKRLLAFPRRAAHVRPLPSNNKRRCDHTGHSAFSIQNNQQIKNSPLPPQQHQLSTLHTSKYSQNDKQNDPGRPLG